MAVTKSWEREISLKLADIATPPERRTELWWLAGASALVACGLILVGAAKARDFGKSGDLLNLNAVADRDQLLPFLLLVPMEKRAPAAAAIFDYLQSHPSLQNVGALRSGQPFKAADGLLPGAQLAKLKPLLIVRTPRQFFEQYLLWCLLYFGAFWLVHLAWRWRRFRGDPALLAVLHLLTGIGLMLAVSLRDPLRDTLDFRKFAWGVAAGCVLLLLPLLRFFHHHNFARLTYTPLFAALTLFLLLLIRGSGPTGSDAKVNLGPFQPVE